MPKPQPLVVSAVCSECGLCWEDHGPKPTLADCVRLLKARPAFVYSPSWVYPQHYKITYDNGYVSSSSTTVTPLFLNTTATVTSRDDEEPPDAVAAVA